MDSSDGIVGELKKCGMLMKKKRASDGATFVSPAKWYISEIGRGLLLTTLAWKEYGMLSMSFTAIRSTLRWNCFLHCLKKAVYLMVNVLLSGKSFGSLVLSTSK